MLKELIESLGIGEKTRIALYSMCVTAIAMYFICDRVLFAERGSILNQNQATIDSLKQKVSEQGQQLADYAAALQRTKAQADQFNQEIARLQPFEQAVPQWRKALDDERERTSGLQAEFARQGQVATQSSQAVDACVAERNELRTSLSRLNEVVTSYGPLLSRRNEIQELERSKEAVEASLAALDGSAISREFDEHKIEQLKRLSTEYQQQILQLRQCKN